MNDEELKKFNLLSDELRKMVQFAYFDSKTAHDLIFTYDKDKQIAALSYLNKANAQMYSAKSLYFSNYDILIHQDIEYVFDAFEVYSKETLNNYSRNHSHQWTNIEFLKFQNALQESVFALTNV